MSKVGRRVWCWGAALGAVWAAGLATAEPWELRWETGAGDRVLGHARDAAGHPFATLAWEDAAGGRLRLTRAGGGGDAVLPWTQGAAWISLAVTHSRRGAGEETWPEGRFLDVVAREGRAVAVWEAAASAVAGGGEWEWAPGVESRPGEALAEDWRWALADGLQDGDFRGVVNLGFEMTLGLGAGAWPLLSWHEAEGGDAVWLVRDEDGHGWLEIRSATEVRSISARIMWRDGWQRLELSLGYFWPEKVDLDLWDLAREQWAGRLWARWNGEIIWAEEMDFSARLLAAGQPAWGRHWDVMAGVVRFFAGTGQVTSWGTPMELLEAWAASRAVRLRRGGEWEGATGPLRLVLAVPEGAAGRAEPLLTTGETGAGDFLVVRYESATTLRVGFDHWGAGGPWSELITVEPGRPQSVVVSWGNLWPARDNRELYAAEPGWAAMRDQVVVWWNGRRVLHEATRTHAGGEIQFWSNHIGGSSSGAHFTGRRVDVGWANPAAVVAAAAAAGDLGDEVP